MGKYEALWKWISENGTERFSLRFSEIEKIAGVPLDHSFLKYKKELPEYGFKVGKISMKEQTVLFEKIPEKDC
ncbi:MAG: hypothetical protein IKE28_06705 [Solobacterium sp.]|nr:hypothetical protein [Solobacterium sp.]